MPITVLQAKRRVGKWARDEFPAVLREQLRTADRLIGAAAVNPPHMRDGRADPGAASRIRFTRTGRARRSGFRFPRRRPEDNGPLRKLTGTLARSMRPGGKGAVSRVEVRSGPGGIPAGAVLRKGSTVPYAARQEKAYPYLGPAAEAQRAPLRRRFEREAAASLRRALATGAR